MFLFVSMGFYNKKKNDFVLSFFIYLQDIDECNTSQHYPSIIKNKIIFFIAKKKNSSSQMEKQNSMLCGENFSFNRVGFEKYALSKGNDFYLGNDFIHGPNPRVQSNYIQMDNSRWYVYFFALCNVTVIPQLSFSTYDIEKNHRSYVFFVNFL